ncbi:MAG: glycosyl hydrolase [Planctomycetota bacterium]|nr:glycosyl hydrolase [Planctomycetota bacterium]
MRTAQVCSMLLVAALGAASFGAEAATDLEKGFRQPPASARPWVYWFFMDGNLTREGMTADLEAMKQAGIGGAIILEVNIGIPRGPVEFMSEPWRELLKHAINEADRLGLEIALGAGPGWCGTGGPWVKPEQSMQHLVASETQVTGPAHFDAPLPQPQPRKPYFGEDTLTPELHKIWKEFYRDVVVLAFPTPAGDYRIPDVDEKALYFRAPFSSMQGVKPFLTADRTVLPAGQCIASNQVIELTARLSSDGRLVWDVPAGNWTIMRFGRTITGQTTRPAPVPGLGFESDKFDKAALDAHFESFVGALLKTVGEPKHPGRGLTTVHFDSWEMSSQNWSERFREEFRQRRGYDPLRFLPAMLGHVVESVAVSERFLWDLRRTAQELVVENHALRLKELGRQHGLKLSIEPYDLNPAGDLALGGVADVPMCEFWSNLFNTDYSVFEAVSIAHTQGRPIVGAESFTGVEDGWRKHPGSMKMQGDWALCAGINRFVFHRYQHQPWLDRRPGMTMGNIGVHWERTQTWWGMASAYHTYLARCQALLRRGLPVADILYLDGEGAPNVFRPPASATLNGLPDRRGYNFDGCAPGTLIERASVKDGRIVFPDGMSYRLLVLPRVDAMTPALLRKIKQLTDGGAIVLGTPPQQSPSLVNYPACDAEAKELASQIRSEPVAKSSDLYPTYDVVAGRLAKLGVPPDFDSNGDLRYTHRRDGNAEVYFVSNRTDRNVNAACTFRLAGKQPELWDPMTGACRLATAFTEANGSTSVPLEFAPHGSLFVVFRQPAGAPKSGSNFPSFKRVCELTGPWEVCFDPKWGGPERVTFAALDDWSKRPEDGIKFYSGAATYRQEFSLQSSGDQMFLDLGKVAVMARVKLNGTDLGIVWTDPYRVDITAAAKPGVNTLEITVVNLWPNRLIGDQSLPEGKRFTWSTWNPFNKDSPLLVSGLLGPVQILSTERTATP